MLSNIFMYETLIAISYKFETEWVFENKTTYLNKNIYVLQIMS